MSNDYLMICSSRQSLERNSNGVLSFSRDQLTVTDIHLRFATVESFSISTSLPLLFTRLVPNAVTLSGMMLVHRFPHLFFILAFY